MVLLDFSPAEYENDSREMIKAFFSEEKIVVETGEPVRFCVKVRVSYGEELNDIEVSLHSQERDYDRTLAESIAADVKKQTRNKFKRMLYDLLKEYTQRELPWGTLTGVRPAKIAYGLLDEGRTEADITEYLKKEYYVSDRKCHLAIKVAENERQLLKKADYENGYSLYVGIPFCPTTCLYCSFTSYPLCNWKNKVDSYVDTLVKELAFTAKLMKNKKLDSFYMGGGTPTTLEPEQMDRVLSCFEENFDILSLKEYTVEAGRPDSITMDKLKVLKKHGVDRISINPQTMNDDTLKLIGRQHNVAQVKEAFQMARECGFENINMDLIVGLPGENEEYVRRTMEEVVKLSPDSLTVHSLAIKRASRLNILWEQYKGYDRINTDNIINMTADYAAGMGMEPYYMYRQKNMAGNFENVGYSKPGKEGLYNVLIMEEKQTIAACGAGSVSKRVFPEGRIERCDNVKEVSIYMEKIDEMLERKRVLFL